MSLTKIRIVEDIAEQNGYTKKNSTYLVEVILETIKKTLASGEDVLISGFGKFCVKEKKERRGRNLNTGDDMILRPRKVVTFRCSGKLRDKINKQQQVLHIKTAYPRI
jgi:integration host factor subunit alpha